MGGKLGVASVTKFVAKYGIDTYQNLKNHPELKGKFKELGLEVHHLLEQRFAGSLRQKAPKMLSIVMSKTDHIKMTTLWRLKIGYKSDLKRLRTDTASPEEIYDAARKIYNDFPEIKKALNL